MSAQEVGGEGVLLVVGHQLEIAILQISKCKHNGARRSARPIYFIAARGLKLR